MNFNLTHLREHSLRKAFSLACSIFEISKIFPREEKYSLTDQIRRSSRSVAANIGEAYRKKRYPKHFVSKMTDADAELSETLVWLYFAYKCKYIDKSTLQGLKSEIDEVGKLLGSIIQNPAPFTKKKN